MSSSDIRIERVCEPSAGLDEALAQLIPLLGPGHRLPSREDLAAMLADERVSLLAARSPEAKGRILGIVALVFYRVPTGLRARIEDLVVAEEGRHAGVGRRLMEAALQVARDAHAHAMDLTCNPRRVAANHLYRQLGFQLWETNVYRLELD